MHKINISFKKYLKDIIFKDKKIKKFYLSKHSHSKYSIDDIIDGILFVLKTGVSWRDSKSSVNWHSLYFHFQRFVKHNIFKKTFIKLRSLFMSKNNTGVQIIDSTFIQNKLGKNHIARNKFFKNKNCNKISLVTDINGIPLSVLINSGNVHDLSFVDKHVDDLFILNKKYNKNITFLADKAYESKKIRTDLSANNYTFMIPKKVNMKVIYHFDKNLYKNRLHIEHTFQKIKASKRIMLRYDSLLTNFMGFVFLSLSQLLFNKIQF